MPPQITDVYPTKAQFMSGDCPAVYVELHNPDDADIEVRLSADLMREDAPVAGSVSEIGLKAGETKRILVSFPSCHAEFQGYGVDVSLAVKPDGSDSAPHRFSGALDVVSDWRKSMRYGFLSDFYASDIGDPHDVEMMNKFHINLVQFYDWMYRHDNLLPPADDFADLMGRTLSLAAVRDKIALCRTYGMKTMAYGAVYAAGKAFYEKHPDWGLYDSSGRGIDFIGIFRIMNIADPSPWRDHLIGQYRAAVERLDFDGIHMDTYGFPKTALSKLNGDVSVVRLEDHFPTLIADTRAALERSKPDVCLVFNNVGNWPVSLTGPAPQDAVYIEVWNPYERYHHIREIILGAKLHGGGKPVILAAYLKPFREEPPETVKRAETSALLLTAVIVSGGASHLLIGEKNGVLTQGYYVDYSLMREGFVRELRNYYDFTIRYAHLHYDNGLKDVSMTHADGDNREYVFEGFSYTTYGASDRVWVTIKEKPGLKLIHFINLTGCMDDLWNEGKDRPSPVGPLRVRMQVEYGAASVFFASPDRDMGRPCRPEYRVELGERGYELVVDIPELLVWTTLVVRLDGELLFGKTALQIAFRGASSL